MKTLKSIGIVVSLSLLSHTAIAQQAPATPAMKHNSVEQGEMDHSDMDHSKMDHGKMDHGNMDHGDMEHGTMDHSTMDHGDHDHGDMQPATEEQALPVDGAPTIVAKVNGLVCDFCAQALKKVFKKEDAVDTLNVDLDAGEVIISLKPGQTLSSERVKKLIRKSGYSLVSTERKGGA